MSSIPSITVTSPEGTTFSAFALPFPVDAATLPEIDGSFAPPANESMASGEGLSDKFDIMTISDIFEREATKIEFKVHDMRQRKEDTFYAHLPAIYSDMKTKRVGPDGFLRFKCRLCGRQIKEGWLLGHHLGDQPTRHFTTCDVLKADPAFMRSQREQKKKRPAPKPNADDKENVAPSPLPKKPKADLPSTTNTPVPMMLEKPEPLKNAFEKMAKATGAPKKTTKKSAASKKPLSAGQKTIQDFFSR